MTSIKLMRWVALVEATSFLALLVATYFKRTGQGDVGVSVLGPIHGALFLLYVFLAITIRTTAGWSWGTTFWVLVGAVVPFGGYVVDWWMLRDAAQREREVA